MAARSRPSPYSKRLVFENDIIEALCVDYKRDRKFGTYYQICRRSKNLIDSILLGQRFTRSVSFHDLCSHLFLQMERWVDKWSPGGGAIYSYFSTCYGPNTRVLLADGTWMEIGEIVNRELAVDVMSYDTATGKVVASKVTGWIKNPATREEWRKVNATPEASNQRAFYVTGNHEFWVDESWTAIDDVPETEPLNGYSKGRLVPAPFKRHTVERGPDSDLSYQYCIEVQGTHCFFAEGILTKNCIKHGAISLVSREQQIRQRQILAGDIPLESVGASASYHVDFSGERELVDEIRSSLHIRWSDPVIRDAIRYIVEEILANGGIRSRKAVLRTLEYGFDLGIHTGENAGRQEPVEVAKFLLDWTGSAVRQLWVDRRHSPITEFDIMRLQGRYTFLPDIVNCIGIKATKALMATFAGTGLRLPTVAAWTRTKQIATVYEAYLTQPADPDFLAESARQLRMPVDKLSAILQGWCSTAEAGVLDDVPL